MTTLRRTVTIPLQGGLGNQLFQVAAGLVLADRHGVPVRWSDHWLRHPQPGDTQRAFALEGLLAPDELTGVAAGVVGTWSDRLTQRVVERSSDDDSLARWRPRTREVAGYFQRAAYVEQAWPRLHERFRASPRPQHRRLVSTEPGTHGALHYRLGDYLDNPAAALRHGIVAPEYFAQELRQGLAEGIDDWQIISDDPEGAADLLRSQDLPSELRLTSASTGDEWRDLAVLASARTCVISNSSFSWWAAWIGAASHGTRVVAPRPWFADPTAAEPALFPATWERRDRELPQAAR